MKTKTFVTFVNDFDTDERAWNPEIWAQETLALLEENMVIGRLVHTDFENEIASFGDTVNTRKPGEFTAKRKGTSDNVTTQSATATRVQVVLDQHVHTSFIIYDGEESRSFVDLVNEYLSPAAVSLARHVDQILLGQTYQFLDNQVGGVAAGDIKAAMLAVREKQNVLKVPMENRNMILTPSSETEALALDLFISAEQVGDEGTAMREASLGKKLGYQTFMCQNTPGIAAGTSNKTTGGATGSVNGGHAAGETAITVVTDASTLLKAGMYITIEGDTGVYRVVSCTETALVIDIGLLNAVLTEAEITYYTLGDVDLTGDAAVTDAYAAGYTKEINIAASGVIPQVGQLVSFTTSAAAVREAEYYIVSVDDEGAGTGDYYILLDRPLDEALAEADKVCYGPAKQYNLAFDRNAMALVCRPLALPRKGTGASAGIASYNDLAMRVVITYDGEAQGHRVTLDLLCGVKVLDSDRGAIMLR